MESARHQALARWLQVVAAQVRSRGPDLSLRQTAILLSVYLEPPPHTLGSMAVRLGISKPAVTRAVDALEKLEFVRRMPNADDGRSMLLQRTVKGSVFVDGLGDLASGSGPV
jgi:DNA-binding MarR family transcriptional regulator